MARKPAEKTERLLLRLSEKRKFELNLIGKVLPGSATMAGVIAWAIDIAVANTPELENISKVWSPFESDRLIHMVDLYPGALDHEERLLWQFISGQLVFWPTRSPEMLEAVIREEGLYVSDGFSFLLLRDSWDMIKAHVLEGALWDKQAFLDKCLAHGVDPDYFRR